MLKSKDTEAATRGALSKKLAVLKNFAIFTGKHMCWSPISTKMKTRRPATLCKRDFNIVVSCDYCKIFKSTYLIKHIPVAISDTFSFLK